MNIFHKFTQIFSDPYPLEDDRNRHLRTGLMISLFVVCFLTIFRPFGLSELNWPWYKVIPVFIGYGAVTFLVILIADFVIIPAFPNIFDDREWTVGKNIIWSVITIVLIGLGNLFYSSFLGFTGISGTMLLTFQLYTILVAIFPVTILTLLTRIRLLHKNLKVVDAINQDLEAPLVGPFDNGQLIFSSENGKDELLLTPDQFLFAESADNYSDIIYVENNIVRRALLRSSLKRLEEMNTSEFVVRVHRAFLVNVRNVKNVSGSSQGYRLIFDHVEESVPVSRRAASTVKALLSRIHGR